MNAPSAPDRVVAAGAVCWRVVDGTIKVLLVHRETQADVSLPKGKVDPGELLPQTAVREIEEETGVRVALGATLGSIEYTISGGRPKIVHYWAAEVTDDAHASAEFTPNQEIAGVEWLPVDTARAALSYERDREVMDRFAGLVDSGRLRTFAIIVVRHGKAVPPGDWDGPDATRPLLHRGLDQAATIAASLAAFHPVKLISSTAARCHATLEPLSALVGRPITLTNDISQDAYELREARIHKVVSRRLEKRVSAVLCSHGPVIPEILSMIAEETGTPIDAALGHAAMPSTGEFSVLHISLEHPDAGIVAVETHSPLRAR
ncbi:MAG: NUDIX domain-containing protein [Terrimesophilobacter sp.]